MSKLGGYKIINVDATLTLGGAGVVVDNIFDKIEGTRKAVLISGLTTTDGNSPATIVEYPDFFTVFTPESTNLVALLPITAATNTGKTTATFLKLTVDDDDKIYASVFTTTDTTT